MASVLTKLGKVWGCVTLDLRRTVEHIWRRDEIVRR